MQACEIAPEEVNFIISLLDFCVKYATDLIRFQVHFTNPVHLAGFSDPLSY